LTIYILKKIILMNLRWIMILADGTKVTAPNLPFFNETEYRKIYGQQFDYLFNDSN
jgi:hypothetical protein